MSISDDVHSELVQAGAEGAGGTVLMTVPLWQIVLQDISLVASAVAAVCGAILGVHAVYRLWRRRRAAERSGPD